MLALDDARPDPERPQLRLLVANVSYRNEDRGLVAVVEPLQPDVLGLGEVRPEWAAVAGRAFDALRYRVVVPREDAYGSAHLNAAVERAAARPPKRGPPEACGSVAAGRVDVFGVEPRARHADRPVPGEGVAVATRIGLAFGSDHLPLLVEVALR